MYVVFDNAVKGLAFVEFLSQQDVDVLSVGDVAADLALAQVLAAYDVANARGDDELILVRPDAFDEKGNERFIAVHRGTDAQVMVAVDALKHRAIKHGEIARTADVRDAIASAYDDMSEEGVSVVDHVIEGSGNGEER